MNKAAVYITFLIVSVLGVVFYLSLIDKKKEYNKPEYDQEGVVYFDNLEKDDLKAYFLFAILIILLSIYTE